MCSLTIERVLILHNWSNAPAESAMGLQRTKIQKIWPVHAFAGVRLFETLGMGTY